MKDNNEPDIMKILDDLYSGKDISKYYPKEEKQKEPLTMLFEHAELFVATFYSQREKLKGKLNTVIRFNGDGVENHSFNFCSFFNFGIF